MKEALLKKWRIRSGLQFILLAAVIAFAAPQAVHAANGSGAVPSGGGSGLSDPKPLRFVSATLTDGDTNVLDSKTVPLKARIKLLFDKNVVNSTVWGINRECFSLSDSRGTNVPIEVTKIDDTTNFDERQAVFVKPVEPLQPGTTYNLKVAPELKAKNGVTLGGGLTIAFGTTGEAASSTEKTPEKAADAGQRDDTSQSIEAISGDGSKAVNSGSELGGDGHIVGTGSPTDGVQAAQGASGGTVAEIAAQPANAAMEAPNSEATSSSEAGSAEGQDISAPQASGPLQSQKESVQTDASQKASTAVGTAGVTDLGEGGDSHWRFMMFLTALLVAGWALGEVFYFRRRRK
ncbi:Ig-like domain-containing protein [Paenibacillus sp. SI8]|uniref:Ig-like domain-containing protein n=1 Tax=unclassified Paenibacillus TaxID=185978 RepID=UPI00346729BF